MTTIAITGSASGIGAAVRERFTSEGARVIGVDLRGADVEADLSGPEGRRAAAEAVATLCDGELDRLVVCAGLGPHVEDLGLIASVNYFGSVEVLDALLPCLARGTDSAAVAVCSNSAQFGPFQDHPFVAALLAHDEMRAREIVAGTDGFIAYGGSKHALCRAVRHRASEWGKSGVRLNGIAPGMTETPLLQATREHPVWSAGMEGLDVPLGRPGRPEEIAAVIAFLLGPESGYVHGSILYSDGGNDATFRPDRF
jgi:NAD(P)-dependent dehydrogenase (short-subunit alcohol dehydrogenase family)